MEAVTLYLITIETAPDFFYKPFQIFSLIYSKVLSLPTPIAKIVPCWEEVDQNQ